MFEDHVPTPELRKRAAELVAEMRRLDEENPERRGMTAADLMERARRNRALQQSAERAERADG